MTLGDKIRKYRMLKGLTQAQLGSMVKLTGDRIRQYENDVRKPKDGKLMEIADALEINPTTLFDPDYRNPNSVMHTLFELEDLYGLHFAKVGDSFQLTFSEGENYKDKRWLLEGIAAWTDKRNELQPDINDSAKKIADKKEQYITWKARYPYDFGDDTQRNFALMDEFHKSAASLLSQNRKSITTFSEFFKSLLALDTENVIFHASIDKVMDVHSALFAIKLDYIMNASIGIQKAYMDFRQCWQDMKVLGIIISENVTPINGIMHICLSSSCPQIIALFSEYEKLKKEKASPPFDEDAYRMEIDDILKMFNVPIREYM